MTVRDQLKSAVETALPDADQVVVQAVTMQVADVAVTALLEPIQAWIVSALHRGNPGARRMAAELATIIDNLELDLTAT